MNQPGWAEQATPPVLVLSELARTRAAPADRGVEVADDRGLPYFPAVIESPTWNAPDCWK
jgi:hypothetical protein